MLVLFIDCLAALLGETLGWVTTWLAGGMYPLLSWLTCTSASISSSLRPNTMRNR